MPASPSPSVTNPALEQAQELPLGSEVIVERGGFSVKTVVVDIVEKTERRAEFVLDSGDDKFEFTVNKYGSRLVTI